MRQGHVLVLAMLALLPLAGCLDPGDPSTASGSDPGNGPPGAGTGGTGDAMLSGAYTANATQADIQEAGMLARQEGGQMLTLESFPAQFQANGLDSSGCERLRAALHAKPYVARVGQCQTVTRSDDPTAPTSNASGAGAWRFGGSFTTDHTDEDVRAVCKAGTGDESCAIKKSDPPQYSFRFEGEQACREARERVLAMPHVAHVRECAPEQGA